MKRFLLTAQFIALAISSLVVGLMVPVWLLTAWMQRRVPEKLEGQLVASATLILLTVFPIRAAIRVRKRLKELGPRRVTHS
jgi:uncharacterized membrane protein